MNTSMNTTYFLTARHGDGLTGPDFGVLDTVRRTLRASLEHGFITELQSYSSSDQTTWSYREGTEDGAQIMLGLIDVLNAIAPEDWCIETKTEVRRPASDLLANERYAGERYGLPDPGAD